MEIIQIVEYKDPVLIVDGCEKVTIVDTVFKDTLVILVACLGN